MIYGITPGPGQFPGIMRLFKECEHLGVLECIYLDDLRSVKSGDTALFGGWDRRYAMAIRRNCKAKRKYIHWSSPLLQAELAGVELGYLSTIMDMLNKAVIDGIWMNDKGIYDTYKDQGNIFYAPAPFDTAALKQYRKKAIDKEGVFFFSVFSNKQKNIAVQLAAAKLAQKECPFILYVNGLTPEFAAFADTIRLRYIDLKHLPSDDYFEWLSSARLMLGVAASEAFSYISAETLGLGVPTIVSPVVARNFSYSTKSMKKLVVNDISNPHKIAEKIISVLELNDEEYNELMEDCHKTVLGVAKRNNKNVVDCFRGYIK